MHGETLKLTFHMLLADNIQRLFFIMELQYIYTQLGSEFINVIRAKFVPLNFTWLSAKWQVIEWRHSETHNCRVFLLRKLSLALCEADMNFRWSQDAPISAPRMHRHCYGCALVSVPATADVSSLLLVRRV